MSKIINDYYKKAKIMPLLLKTKLKKFNNNPDIEEEFEYWILNKEYKDNVIVEGYTAKSLSKLSKYLDGEGAFMLLIELRENPTKALEKISNGFKLK